MAGYINNARIIIAHEKATNEIARTNEKLTKVDEYGRDA
jgi:hypothetical protein